MLIRDDLLIRDDFEDARSPGHVIGTPSTAGPLRQGIDLEKTLAIDNGALRISPLITPGWQRSGIAYGPFQREAGLALSVFILNGHNASEGNTIEETLKGRFFRWLRGSETHSIGYRLQRWGTSQHHQHRFWHFYRWLRNHKNRFEKDKHLKENLAIGWFSDLHPNHPSHGNAVVVRTAGPENGELCASVHHQLLPAFKGLQNLQTYYIVVLREQGAAYYAATLPNPSALNENNLSAYPSMRLIGIDTQGTEDTIYAGIYQSALGQVGFRVDSRVYGVRAAALSTLSHWYGTAHMADSLTGCDQLTAAKTDTGETWQILQGDYHRTASGITGTSNHNIAVVETRAPAGAVHVIVSTKHGIADPQTADPQTAEFALLWRTHTVQNTWALFLTATHCQLKLCQQGTWKVVETDSTAFLTPNTCHTLQILDTGSCFSLYLSGQLLFNQWFTDTQFQNERSVGLLSKHDISSSATPIRVQRLEVHPRHIAIPPELQMGAPWQQQGKQVTVSDAFQGRRGDALEMHLNEQTQERWEKTIGHGNITITGQGSARVEASSLAPNPGRLAYTLPWPHPNFADVSVDILSPGTKRHEKEKGRGGLIFWQDADNYMIVNHWLDDTFDGSAMSVFLTVDGYEELYDGVWANLGQRIAWGKKCLHRVAFDGLNFVVYVDSEPVLCRSIRDVYPKVSPFQIHRVGIVANWEWGNDTGSEFSNFSALF
ncbi:MAG: hypothetical protein AB8B99_02080 [Phormidesmis sp.]